MPAFLSQKSGFTLLEISIVIVVIGFIVGGIVVGDNMIKEAKIRAALAEYDSYVKGIAEFQEKYTALPGDMSNAESIWGSDSLGTCPSIIDATQTIKQATCNGNGNGRIGDSGTSGTFNNDTYEWLRAWQQLGNSGLVDGKFSGTYADAVNQYQVGTNLPASKYTGGGWTLLYYINSGSGTGTYGPVSGHMLSFGKTDSDGTLMTYRALLPPVEALSIDTKLDDGKPGSGKIITMRTSILSDCTTNDSSQTNATYKTSYTAAACSLLFFPGF